MPMPVQTAYAIAMGNVRTANARKNVLSPILINMINIVDKLFKVAASFNVTAQAISKIPAIKRYSQLIFMYLISLMIHYINNSKSLQHMRWFFL